MAIISFGNPFKTSKARVIQNVGLMSTSYNSNLREAIKSQVQDDQVRSFGSTSKKGIGVEHPFNLELLESAYLSIPLIQGAIDKHVDFVLGSEYKIDTNKELTRKKFEEFVRDNDFDVLLRLIVRDMLIYGSSFLEIVWGGKRVKQLKLLDSKTMYVRRDKKGKVEGYTQFMGKSFGTNVEPVYFKPDEIIHFSFNNIGGSPYGTSVIRALFGDRDISVIKQFLSMQEAMRKLLDKQVNAKVHIQVGDENWQPTQSDIDSLGQKLEAARNDTEWITSYLVKMNILGYEGKILDLTPFANHYEEQMVYGLQTPFALLGKGSIPEGLALVQLEAFERRIKSIQLNVSRELENKLFNNLLGEGNYKFVWCRHEKKELDELNILIRFLAEKFVLSPETRLVIENRIRNLLGNSNLNFNEYMKSLDDDAKRAALTVKKPKQVGKDDGKDDKGDDAGEDSVEYSPLGIPVKLKKKDYVQVRAKEILDKL